MTREQLFLPFVNFYAVLTRSTVFVLYYFNETTVCRKCCSTAAYYLNSSVLCVLLKCSKHQFYSNQGSKLLPSKLDMTTKLSYYIHVYAKTYSENKRNQIYFDITCFDTTFILLEYLCNYLKYIIIQIR